MSTNSKLAEALRACMADIELWMETYKRQAGSLEVLDRARLVGDTVTISITERISASQSSTSKAEQAAKAVPADEPTCFGAGDVERLRAAALAVFDGPECPQIARDVIEWFYGTLLVEVRVVCAAPAAPAPEAKAARTEADGEAYTEGYFDGVRDTEAKAQAAGQELPPLPKTNYVLAIEARPYESEYITSEAGYSEDDLREYARAAVSAANSLAQRQPLTEWQPIETAPKDGTLLLLWEEYESEPFIGSWHAFRSEWEASRTYYDTDGNECVVDRVYSPGVTHWMPLPAAPGATTGEQQP